MATERPERSYRLEPLDTSGVFLGLGIIQCLLLGGAIALGVAAVTAGMPLVVAAAPVVSAAAVSFTRVGGHATWEWLPLAAGWAWAGIGRRRRWVAPLPLWSQAETAAPMPPCLAGLDIVGLDWRATRLGAVRDRHRRTLTAVVPVCGPQFVVEPRAEQERLLAGWGDLLGQFAVERGVVAHLGWSDLARPSGLGDHLAWLDAADRATPDTPPGASYRELLDVGTASAISHDVVVTITVARDRLSRHRARGAGADEALDRALVSSVEALLRGLRSADLAASDPLDPPGLQRLIRSRIDPVAPRALRPRHGRLVDRLAAVRSATAGPVALEAAWGHVRVDAAFHRTWWVGTWPRLAVAPAWLEPFLSGGGITRSMTVYFQPVSAHQSRRRIERDLVKLESDASTKHDKGRRVDARHRRATQALLDREDELVAGYPEMGYAGLVTVSARTLDELDHHAEVIEQLARETGIDLRALDARHDLGWAAALPLGLAPSTLLAP